MNDTCDVCAGVGKAASGPCICGGSGLSSDEKAGLRTRIIELEQREAELVGALQIIAQLKGHSDKVVCLASIQGAAELAQQALQGKGDWVAVPRERIKQMERFAGWIVETVETWNFKHKDGACIDCYPNSSTEYGILEGFKCAYHTAKDMITAANKGGVNE